MCVCGSVADEGHVRGHVWSSVFIYILQRELLNVICVGWRFEIQESVRGLSVMWGGVGV